MRQAVLLLLFAAAALPVAAQRRVDLLIDAEGVRRTGSTFDFTPGATRFEPQFRTGGGVGAGVNWFFSDRVSLELKVAGLVSDVNLRSFGSDFVVTSNLGSAQIYPITALLQWHMTEHGTIRPYIGAGAGHIILHNINKAAGGVNAVKFDDPTGLVLDGGLEFRTSRRMSFFGDARYVPVETAARATFVGTQSRSSLHVRPLIVSFGVAYHY